MSNILPARTHLPSPQRSDPPLAEPAQPTQEGSVWAFSARFVARQYYLALLLSCMCGCSNATSTALQQRDEGDGVNCTSGNTGSGSVITLRHDFGLVRPGEVLRHTFKVSNSSESVWTLKEIKTTCSCTITTASSETIAPGGSTSFNARFRMPGSSGDRTYSMTVLFAEPSAPTVEIIGVAIVRDRLVCTPSEVSFASLEPGNKASTQFEVFNYDDLDWKALKLEADASWITANASMITQIDSNVADGEPHARQAWRVSVGCNTSGLKPGRYKARLSVSPAKRPSQPGRTVTVQARVVSPVSAVPDRLFFGKVVVGRTATAKIALHFAQGSTPSSPDSVRITHTLGSSLEYEWLRDTDSFWLLGAHLTPSAHSRILEGSIVLSFADGKLPDLTIPVSAMVQAGDSL